MFYVLSHKKNNKIELFAVKNAIELTEYFFNNALKVNRIILNPLNSLTEEQKLLYSSMKNKFTTSQIVEIGQKNNIPKRNIMRFLTNKNIFKKIKHGLYKKYND